MTDSKELASVELAFADFGGKPDSGEDAGPAMQRAIEAARRANGPVRLVVEPGRYDFYPQSALKAVYYITNTASESENPDPVKTIGLHMKDLADFTLDGGGALFLYHGKMTLLAIDRCERIVIRDLRTDFAHPTVAEMTIERIGASFMDIRTHPDSEYEISDGRIYWLGKGWRFCDGPMQACDPVRNTTWRIDNVLMSSSSAESLEPGRIRLHYDALPECSLAEGWILQARDGIRDQVGAFIHRSRDVRFERVGVHFTHGLGIVGQYSEDLDFSHLDMSPRTETGRTVAAFADFVHLSGCRGKIRIANSRFIGAHDDAVNVHGTHLRIVEAPSPRQLVVRFMHPQTFGFAAFVDGDEIAFIRSRALTEFGRNRVMKAELVHAREMRLTLEAPVPDDIAEGDVIENATWTPEVEIVDNYFARIPTRGVLATTRRKVVIARNAFNRTGMSAVLVANDAASWYESGPVEDLTIRDNRFVECGSGEMAVISILPENEEIDADAPVHRGIHIENNAFETHGVRILDAKSTRTIAFVGNSVLAGGFASLDDTIRLTACADVRIESNRFEQATGNDEEHTTD